MSTFERHFTVSELAEMWHLSDDKVRELFKNEPGVLAIGSPTQRRGRGYKRRYFTLRIPETVAKDVHSRLRRRPAWEGSS